MEEAELNDLLVSISITYLDQSAGNSHDAIGSSLGRLGEAFDADRVYISRYDLERDRGSVPDEWCRPGIEPQIASLQDVPLDPIRPMVEAHHAGRPYNVADVQELPSGGLRTDLEHQSIRSLLTVPIIDEKGCSGFVGFDFVRKRRTGSDSELAVLAVFAQMVARLQQRERHETQLRESEERYRMLFNSIRDAILVADCHRRIINCNPAFTTLFGYTLEEVRGRTTEMLYARPEDFGVLGNLLKTRIDVPSFFHEFSFRKKDGTVFTGEKRIQYSWNDAGQTTGFIGMIHDISDRKAADEHIQRLLEEKETLVREVHHRIKNNMNAMTSFLSLQTDAVQEPAAAQALDAARVRLQSMQVLYEKLYRSENVSEVPLNDYLPDLLRQIMSVIPTRTKINLETRIEDVVLGVRQLSVLGMVINELVTNALKYAFNDREHGSILVSAARIPDNGNIAVTVADDGFGLPESVDVAKSEGFGLALVGTLAEQLDGAVRIERERGTRVVLTFPMLQT